MLLVMVLLWGVSWPAMKAALHAVPPLWLATIRFGTASASLFVFLALRQGGVRLPRRSDIPIVASIGLLQMMAFSALGLLAMMRIEAGHAALLAYTTPLWVTIGTAVLSVQRVNAKQLAGVSLGLLGILVVCAPSLVHSDSATMQGNAMLLVAAICWAIVILHVRGHRWTSSPIDLAPWQMALAAVPLGIAACLVEGLPRISWNLTLIALVVLVGPLATCCCFVISAEVGRRIAPITMSLATLGVPVTGLAVSIAFLGEPATYSLLIGVALIVSSLAMVVFDTKGGKASAPSFDANPDGGKAPFGLVSGRDQRTGYKRAALRVPE